MGFYSSFGKKLSNSAHSMGQKAHSVAQRGRKYIHEHAGEIEKVSKTIGDVAGVVGNVATAALPFTAEIPGVGEVVAGLAAGGKGIEAGAKWVGKVAKTAKTAESALGHGEEAISAMRKGNIISAYKEGEKAVKEGQQVRKQIERKKK